MKKIKEQKGAITVITLVSILFMVSFLISSFIFISNKSRAQKEMVAEIRKIYESKATMEEIYNSFTTTADTIPIYTVEQLLSIGSEKTIAIAEDDGKIYNFSKNANYELMNDLSFNTANWTEILGEGKEWTPIGEVVKDNIGGFTGTFEGNNYTISVTDLNGILHECNNENSYYYYRNINIIIGSTEKFNETGEFSLTVEHNGKETTFNKNNLVTDSNRKITITNQSRLRRQNNL